MSAFHSHHVPEGVIKLKEFWDLKQGPLSVIEYVTHFSRLSRYAPIDVDTDEKKHDCFLDGLNDGLAYELKAHDFETSRPRLTGPSCWRVAEAQWSTSASKSDRMIKVEAPGPC
jgi:hypothetical protein